MMHGCTFAICVCREDDRSRLHDIWNSTKPNCYRVGERSLFTSHGLGWFTMTIANWGHGGVRSYATNHSGLKDFGTTSREDRWYIFEYETCYDYTWIWIACSSVSRKVYPDRRCNFLWAGRSKPERLLPPVATVPRDARGLLPEHYRLTSIMKKMCSIGIWRLNRQKFWLSNDQGNSDVMKHKVDTVKWGNILSYPILVGGASNTSCQDCHLLLTDLCCWVLKKLRYLSSRKGRISVC